MLARLNHIDFRREQDFEAGICVLVDILRGRPARRGSPVDAADARFREDAALLKQHRRILDRPAFRISCIWELFLRELLGAIDDTTAAINTGSLYSRSEKLLSTFPDQNEYQLTEFKRAFSRITAKLTNIKRQVVQFEEYIRTVDPNYSSYRNFYAMVVSFARTNPSHVRTLVAMMDDIDQMRNEILGEVNVLLAKCGEQIFESIELSSRILKTGQIHGVETVAPLLK
jgi:hypothetical protein